MTILTNTQLVRRPTDRIEYLTPSSPTDYILSSSIKAGEAITVINNGTSTLTVKSSNGNTVDILGKSKATFIAVQDTPTTSAHWYETDIVDVGPYQATVSAGHSGLSAGSPISVYFQTLTVSDNPYGIQNGLAADLHTFTFPAAGWYEMKFTVQMDVNNAATSVNARLESVGGTTSLYNAKTGSDFLTGGEVAGEAQTVQTHGVITPVLKVTAPGQTFQTKFNYSIAINGNLTATLWVNIRRVSKL